MTGDSYMEEGWWRTDLMVVARKPESSQTRERKVFTSSRGTWEE